MADENLRRDARAVETPEEASALLVQRLRAGDIERARVELAAGLGDETARSVLGEPPPLLERLPALQRVRDLGPAAWVAAERACLAAWPDAERSDLLRGALEALEAWLAEPSLERAQAARQRARPAPPTWPIGRAAAGLVAVLDDPLLGARPLCSWLTRSEAEHAQRVLDESGALGLIVPDAAVPVEQRRPTWRTGQDEPAKTGPGSGDAKSAWSLALSDSGSHKIACIKEVRGLTGMNLRDSKNLVDEAPTSACWWLSEWDETRATLCAGFVPWLLR